MSYVRLDKNLYEITIEVGIDVTGKRRRIKRRFRGTRQEMILKHAELMKEYYHNNKKLNLNNLTFKEYSKLFVNNYCISNVSKITLRNYEQMLKIIIPLIGDVKLRNVTTFMLDNMYQKIKLGKMGKELSPKTMLHYYNLINIMFKQAKKWKFIEINPNGDAIKPRFSKSKRRFYNNEQVIKLLGCLLLEDIRIRTIIILALDSGIRRSELCALRWNDVDFNNRTIYIDNSLKVIKGEVDEEKAKTQYSIRTIYLGNKTIELLKEYKRWQDNYIIAMGDKWVGTDRVFTARDGNYMHPDTTNKILQKVLEKYGLPKLTFHELRHTCASVLNSYGIDPKTISERLGHADTSVTMDIYTHIFNENKMVSACVFDNLQNLIK